jgi:hypothetical protein
MRNPYVQVGLTYPRRWRSITTGLSYLAVFFLVLSSCYARGSNRTPDPVLFVMIGLFTVNGFLALSLHIRRQFADSRARLTPGFCRVHAAVAVAVIGIVTVLLPGAVTWLLGLRSVGLVAIAVCLFSAALWLVLLASMWLSVVIGLFMAVGYGALFVRPVSEAVIALASGGYESSAIALLIAGVASIAVGMRRLTVLNEDMPFYNGWLAGCEERSRAVAVVAAFDGTPRRGLRERCEEKRIVRLIEHARRAPMSRWSAICRWRAMVPVGWLFYLMIGVTTFLMLALFMLFVRQTAPGVSGLMPIAVVAAISLCLPTVVAAGQLLQRMGRVGHELLLPVERTAYMRQVAAEAALGQAQCWIAMVIAIVAWWLLFVGEAVSWREMAGILGGSAVLQIWLFGAVVWGVRHKRATMSVAMVGVMAVAMSTPIMTDGFTVMPQAAEWGRLVIPVCGALAVVGVLLIWAAYRCWLVTDFD